MKRRDFLRATIAIEAGAFGVGIGLAPKFTSPARAATSGLAAGMTGGPTGFLGAEAYQYNDSMSEGRAIEGNKRFLTKLNLFRSGSSVRNISSQVLWS